MSENKVEKQEIYSPANWTEHATRHTHTNTQSSSRFRNDFRAPILFCVCQVNCFEWPKRDVCPSPIVEPTPINFHRITFFFGDGNQTIAAPHQSHSTNESVVHCRHCAIAPFRDLRAVRSHCRYVRSFAVIILPTKWPEFGSFIHDPFKTPSLRLTFCVAVNERCAMCVRVFVCHMWAHIRHSVWFSCETKIFRLKFIGFERNGDDDELTKNLLQTSETNNSIKIRWRLWSSNFPMTADNETRTRLRNHTALTMLRCQTKSKQ